MLLFFFKKKEGKSTFIGSILHILYVALFNNINWQSNQMNHHIQTQPPETEKEQQQTVSKKKESTAKYETRLKSVCAMQNRENQM